jgi:dihydrofolate synthase / folylpolyglutamate synthase
LSVIPKFPTFGSQKKFALTAYQQTIDYLYRQLPMFQRIGPAAFKKDLTNTVLLAAHLGNPHLRYPTIHIAGTNGKGSVAHMTAAILQAHGLKTGLYISPHYRDFRERIKINGRYVSRSYIVDFVARHKDFFSTLEPSFFEITVAMAFDYFAREKVDVAVIETGLGGRLDSTNIIRPVVSVITNISYDHQQFLGDTLAQIAGEKAGIIKDGVPVVIGETHPETRGIFLEKAASLRAPITFADQLWKAEIKKKETRHTVFDVFREGTPVYRNLYLNALGDYQAGNLLTALQSAEIAIGSLGLEFREEFLREGLFHLRDMTSFIGRWQPIGQDPLIICDSAHNEGGIEPVIRQLMTIECRRLHIVFGMVNDKEPGKVLRFFPQAPAIILPRPISREGWTPRFYVKRLQASA